MIASPRDSIVSNVNSRRNSEGLAPPPPEHGEQCLSCCPDCVWVYAKVTTVVTTSILVVIVMMFTHHRALKAWLNFDSHSSEPPERADGTQSQHPADTRTTDTPDRGSGTQDLESSILEQLPFGSIVKKTADRVRCHECRKKLPQRTLIEVYEAVLQSRLDLVSQSGKATDPCLNLCAKCTQESTRLQLLSKSCSHTHVVIKDAAGKPWKMYPAAELWLVIDYIIDISFATDYVQHHEVRDYKDKKDAINALKIRMIMESFLLNREMSHHTKSLLMLLDTLSEPDENCQPLNAKSGVPEFEAQSSEF